MTRSRWANYVDNHGKIPPLPELEAGEYLLNAMHDAGAFTQSDMGGVASLTWLELGAYCNQTGELGEPWENKTVIELSREYVSGYNIGTNPLGIPPYDVGETVPIVSGGIFAKLKARAKNG